MNILLLCFWLFASLGFISALMVVFAKSPVHALLGLISTFIATSCLWMLLEAEFLAVALLLIYVGAVMVLFLFVVMMLHIEQSTIQASFARTVPIGLILSLTMAFGALYVINQTDMMLFKSTQPLGYSHLEAIALLLYTQYWYPVVMIGVVLLAAMVAAISITFRGAKDRKTQNIDCQVSVNKKSRLTMVNMDKHLPGAKV